MNNKQIVKYKITNFEKYSLREELETLGINHSVLFPGLDGVCKSINDKLVFCNPPRKK